MIFWNDFNDEYMCKDTTNHRLVMNSEISLSKVLKITSPIFQHIVYMYWEIDPHPPFQWPSCLRESGVRMQNRVNIHVYSIYQRNICVALRTSDLRIHNYSYIDC